LNRYELVYILHPDLEGSLEVVTSRIQKLVTDASGTIVSEDIWGKRKLAYQIGKQNFGVYVVLVAEIPGEKVAGIERELRLMDEVIRHLLVTMPKPRAKAKPVRKPRTTKRPEPAKPVGPQKSESERLEELDKKLEEIIGPADEAEPKMKKGDS
jgi:small subunit ribosomal protein S6